MFNKIIGSVVISFAIVAGLSVIQLLYLLFSSSDDVFHHTGMFNSVFVESVEKEPGVLSMSYGFQDAPRFLLLIAVVAVVIFAIWQGFDRTSKKNLEVEKGTAMGGSSALA